MLHNPGPHRRTVRRELARESSRRTPLTPWARLFAGAACAVCVVASSGCSDDEPSTPPPGDNCGFEANDSFLFTRIELDESNSSSSCIEVTPEDANGAGEPDCQRVLQGCELVLNCIFEPVEGVEIAGTGRLELTDAGTELTGPVEVELGGATCRYDVTAQLE